MQTHILQTWWLKTQFSSNLLPSQQKSTFTALDARKFECFTSTRQAAVSLLLLLLYCCLAASRLEARIWNMCPSTWNCSILHSICLLPCHFRCHYKHLCVSLFAYTIKCKSIKTRTWSAYTTGFLHFTRPDVETWTSCPMRILYRFRKMFAV